MGGYGLAMTSPASSSSAAPPPEHPEPDHEHHPLLEALNAEGVVEHPERPGAEPDGSPADDAAAPPP